MSKRRRDTEKGARREERRFTVRSVRRDPPDIRKLSRALISLAMAEAEREAQAEQDRRQKDAEVTSASTGERKG